MDEKICHLPLHRIAHGRAGDKGDTANISVIAYQPQFFSLLVDQVTEERVREVFRHRSPSSIRRYVLPNLAALNFVLEGTLDGGVNTSLNLDAHGKTLAFQLLGISVCVPRELVSLAIGSGS